MSRDLKKDLGEGQQGHGLKGILLVPDSISEEKEKEI